MPRLQRFAQVSAWVYLGAVALYWFALHVVGEGWWLTTVALYLPHVLTLVPALPLVGLLGIVGPRRLTPVPVVATMIVLFPIMGLVMCGGSAAPSGGPRLRVLSYNVDSARRTPAALAAQVHAARPDIVLLQDGTCQRV